MKRLLLPLVLLLGALGVYCFAFRPVKPKKRGPMREVVAKNGTRRWVDLPDGSRVCLNGGSSVRFAVEDSRVVELHGEGFFDIRDNFGRQFVIHTGPVDVKVSGARLNVRAYSLEGYSETFGYRISGDSVVVN